MMHFSLTDVCRMSELEKDLSEDGSKALISFSMTSATMSSSDGPSRSHTK